MLADPLGYVLDSKPYLAPILTITTLIYNLCFSG